jgi:hypothetical protein
MRCGVVVGILLALVVDSAASAGEDKTAAALIACAPKTYDAALDCLDKNLPADLQAKIAQPGGALHAHFGLGMWIRNNWGLWQQGPLYRSMQAYGFTQPDDMSGAILEGFAARENAQPFDITTKAAEYQAQDKILWDQAVKEGRAGHVDCPKPVHEPKSAEEAAAVIEACLDNAATAPKDDHR